MVLGNCHRRRVWALLLRTIVLINASLDLRYTTAAGVKTRPPALESILSVEAQRMHPIFATAVETHSHGRHRPIAIAVVTA